MDVTAPHFGYVAGAYALSAVFIVGLVIWVLARDRALRKEVMRLDSRRHEKKP